MTRIWTLQYDRWLIGVYSSFEHACLAREDEALARKTTIYDDSFNILPHKLDDSLQTSNRKGL
jgi:hypothetical protein